ncbi:ElaA protein [Prauserella marina]|uniref:ElaA protein n=1 Tax=Prauserella marina TaxID=530584 RepID=A0A1G6MBN9_9PSEU|nr:ElaA protein [Prauserella marina]SDC52992.1 ElaA protein [Prauserella marina]
MAPPALHNGEVADFVSRSGPELTPAELYALLRLRVDVFVVEQNCPYPELDGKDLLPTTQHIWESSVTGEVTGCLRVLGPLSEAQPVWRIGRVCTADSARGTGLGGRLMEAALAFAGDVECVLDAQTYAEGFYSRHGFVREGAEFEEDGIPHVTMRRTPSR